MSTVPVTVDSHLRIDANLLGNELVENLLDAVTIQNQARIVAKRLKRWGWQELPESFLLAELDGDTLVLPRGYALQLKRDLRTVNKRVRWIDKTKWERGATIGPDEFSWRAHQPAAVRQIVRHRQGIYKAPTGSGKTVTVVGAIWTLNPANAIIHVNSVSLLEQWKRAFLKHTTLTLDDIGIIGAGKWDEKRITIATVQTLYKHIDRLKEEGFFKKWSLLCQDECHHTTARTFYALDDLYEARYRFGVSATPEKTGDFEFAQNVLGEVFYEDDEDELIDAGVLVKPHVEVFHTDFNFPYHGNLEIAPDEKCPLPGCKRTGTRHGHRDNYGKMKSALVEDKRRNELIAHHLGQMFKHRHQIVISSETTQIDSIADALYNVDRGKYRDIWPQVWITTGKINKKQREIAYEQFAKAESGILLSTVAGEGLDIPNIDRVHIPFPTKNKGTVEQWIGRGTRSSGGKESAVITDYADTEVSILAEHFRIRLNKVYYKKGLEVIIHD